MTDMSLNNTTNMSNVTCQPYRKSPSIVDEPKASETFRTAFMSLIIFFGIVGNALVLRGAINRKKRPFIYYLVINLAQTEILICCLQPFQMVVERPPYYWQAGPFMCQLVSGMEVGASLIVTFTLAAIAAYRAVVITRPKITRPSVRVAYGIMALSWIWGAAFSIPYGLNRELKYYPDPCLPAIVIISCDLIEENTVFDTAYKIGFFYVPFAVILASYGIVIYKIKQHTRSEAANARRESIELTSITTRVSFADNDNNTAQFHAGKPGQDLLNNPAKPLAWKQRSSVNKLMNNKEKNKGKIFELEKDVLNLLYILILIFFICYIPWTIMYMLMHIAKVQSVLTWRYGKIFEWYKTLIHTLPSALHPICYGAASNVIILRSPCLRCPWNQN